MPPCNKECKVKVYEVRNIQFTNQFPVNGGAQCNKTLKRDQKLVNFVKGVVESRADPIEGEGCPEGCICDPIGQPDMGRTWKTYKFKMTIKAGANCSYPIEGTYEKRAGISRGVCIPREEQPEDDFGEVELVEGGGNKGKAEKKGKPKK
jgi:hypothetical protein